MTQEGKLLICDRCGATLFVPKNGTQFNIIDGYSEESSTYQEYNPNWGYLSIYPKPPDVQLKDLKNLKTDFEIKMLCPECRDKFVALMYRFWKDKS